MILKSNCNTPFVLIHKLSKLYLQATGIYEDLIKFDVSYNRLRGCCFFCLKKVRVENSFAQKSTYNPNH